jgi:hypothetical protein
MLKPGETREETEKDSTIVRLLKPWAKVDEIRIERQAVYRFHARVCKRFSKGRVFLAGDEAHVTPPFAGQGLVAGLRDAANLAWVVRGRAAGAILDTYDQERRPHAAKMSASPSSWGSSSCRATTSVRWSSTTTSDILELTRCTCTAAASNIPYRETVGSMGPFQRTTAVLTEALGTAPELRARFHGVRASSQAHADPRKQVDTTGFEPAIPTVSISRRTRSTGKAALRGPKSLLEPVPDS